MSYKQTLYQVITPIKQNTIHRLNKKKAWEYGYNKEHDVIVISKTGMIGEIYNIGGNKSISVGKVLDYLKSFSKSKILTKIDKNLIRIKDINIQVPSSNKFRKHTSWKPKISIKDSLKKLLMNERLKRKVKI